MKGTPWSKQATIILAEPPKKSWDLKTGGLEIPDPAMQSQTPL